MFKGLGQLGDIAKIAQQAQEMQRKMAELQTRLDEIEVEGVAGAGLVRATVTAKGALKAVAIDPSLLSAEERDTVQDLIVAAVNDAQAKGRERMQAEMQELAAASGMPFPPGMMG
ncbi:MAG: YbaB/EbfC family nucleoid-associated protein [Pseudomonadota bacterium]